MSKESEGAGATEAAKKVGDGVFCSTVGHGQCVDVYCGCLSVHSLSNIVINSDLPVILNITEVVHWFGYVFPEVYI